MKILRLKKVIHSRKGTTYLQRKKRPYGAVYEIRKNGKAILYMVFPIKYRVQTCLFGYDPVPFAEVFPSISEIGDWAFTYRTLQAAVDKLNTMKDLKYDKA